MRVRALAVALGIALALLAPAVALGQLRGAVSAEQPQAGPTLDESDRLFPMTQPAANLPALGARVGTVDQLETLQGRGGGFAADVYAEFAPLAWLTIGATVNDGTLGDEANQVSPTAYLRGQFLSAREAGVDAAAELRYKKQGFDGADGELESMLLLGRQLGRLRLAWNGVYGKSYTQPDADAESRLAFGYDLSPNLLIGADSLARLDLTAGGGPRNGTRPWELTVGPTVGYKWRALVVNLLAGAVAPMYLPGWGETAMVQLSYSQ